MKYPLKVHFLRGGCKKATADTITENVEFVTCMLCLRKRYKSLNRALTAVMARFLILTPQGKKIRFR